METSALKQRQDLVDAYLAEFETGGANVSALARRFGVSRKTAQKWIDRFMARSELGDRSRRPHSSPSAVPEWLEDAIVAARRQKPLWGARKLRTVLQNKNPGVELPAVSTFALIFKRNGLVRPRRRRNRTPPFSAPFGAIAAPNDLWCVDFKGQFMTGRSKCYPLTVMDAHSRYLLACVALRRIDADSVRRAFQVIFDAYGLPTAIRTDNGPPFASTGLAGLSRLSAWWLKLDIRHERIAPGHPEQNGRHERMHLTLKQGTAMPPANSFREQQRRFDRFRLEYNDERPHEALAQLRPCDIYEPSRRPLPEPPWGRDFAYPSDWETVRVDKRGVIRWNDRRLDLSPALAHQILGLQWRDDGGWDVYFGTLRLGLLHPTRTRLRFERIAAVSPMSLD